MNEHIDMNISGSSTMPGGEYGSVSISGAGKINGSLKCTGLHCSGAARIHGSADCSGEIRSSGSVKIEGSAHCQSLSASGSLIVDAELTVQQQSHSSGSVHVSGHLTADEIHASGSLDAQAVHCREFKCSGACRIAGDLEAETAVLSGAAEIGGLLNAEAVELAPSRYVHIGAIGGSSIRIHQRDTTTLFGLFRTNSGCAKIGSIEGDEIALEYVEAETVRGRNVHIGAGCKIGRVEYSGTLTAEPGTVGQSVYTGAEAGSLPQNCK